jgi:protein-disulfide isomerase
MDEQKQNEKSSLGIPGAIIIVGVLIAGAILLSNKSNAPAPTNNNTQAQQVPNVSVKPVSASDHILGDPNAPIVIVEYSDPSCPFCKLFQSTMETIINTYATSGKVAWVYRHFPLDKPNQDGQILHPNAGHEAQAFECAATLGDNNVFWAYEEEWYNVFPLQGATDRDTASDTAQLAQVAKDNGIDVTKFTNCLSNGMNAQIVEDDYQGGIAAGAQGTPYSVMVLKTPLDSATENNLNNYLTNTIIDGTQLSNNISISSDSKEVVLNGNIPLENVTYIINTILK